MRSIFVAVCLTSFASALAHPQAGEPAPEPELREECFALELQGESLGFARWRRRDEGLAFELELEVWFASDRTRIHMVEREHPRDAKFVWRELRPRAGRTLIVRRSPDRRKLEVLEWGGRECLREERRSEESIEFLPALIELARDGHTGRFMAFDPLGRCVEALELSSTPFSEAIHASVSTVQSNAVDSPAEKDALEAPDRVAILRRADGTLSGRYFFRGERLVAFTWGDGSIHAQRIGRAEFEQRRVDYESGTRED